MHSYGAQLKGVSASEAKNTAVIGFDELMRIKAQCQSGNELEIEARNRERQELQQKSKARV